MMKSVWVFSLIGLHLSLGWAHSDSISGSCNSNNNLNIGAIFSLETVNAKVSRIGMQAAVDDINSDSTILGGRKLSLSVHDANRSGFLSIMGALRFMKTDYVAIIGPQSSKMAHVLSPLANELHIPLLSFTALDPTLSLLQYPYFIKTAPNDLYQMTAIADMISYFGWTEVVAIFTDETRNGISVLGRKLEKRRCRISYKAALPTDFKGNGRKVMMGELLKVKTMVDSRVIVVHTSTVSGPLILKLAKELGMVRAGYAWLATSWLSNVLDSSDQDSSDGYDIGSVQGVLTLRHHTPDSKKKSDFISRWNKLSSHGTIINSNNYSVGLNPNGLYAYDTVWLIARALRAFLDKGYNITFSNLHSDAVGARGSINLSIFDGGEDLLKLILRANLTGVTGQMAFNIFDSDNRYSMSNNPSFDILDVVGNRLRLVGYWSNYSGLSVDPPRNFYEGGYSHTVAASPRLMDDRMIWPGGGRKVPRGWVFSHGGKKLRIGVPYRASFRGFVSVDNRTDSNNVSGCSIDVFLTAVKLLPYPLPFEFVVFGDGRHNPNYDDIISRIRTKEFDAVVGDIAIVTSRTKNVDFTLPFIESGLVVVAPAQKMDSSAWAFLKPFTPFMWIVTAICCFCLGAVIWILEHGVNQEFRGTPRKQLVKAFWYPINNNNNNNK